MSDTDMARLIEDRTRFPDRPDDIGRMISAHYGNLKYAKESSENYARQTMMHTSILAQTVQMVKEILSDTKMSNPKRVKAALDEIGSMPDLSYKTPNKS